MEFELGHPYEHEIIGLLLHVLRQLNDIKKELQQMSTAQNAAFIALEAEFKTDFSQLVSDIDAQFAALSSVSDTDDPAVAAALTDFRSTLDALKAKDATLQAASPIETVPAPADPSTPSTPSA